MPLKITNIRKVMLLGSGALKIGEAGEFDYSGSQALKALKEEGISTILINPNIATVQTSADLADKIYFLPVTPYFVEKVIEKEKPDGIFLSFGGQTALNCGVELYKNKILKKHNISVLGTPVSVIIDTEDRDLFVKRLTEININVPRSIAASSMISAIKAARSIGYPVIIRIAYELGGKGSGFAANEKELKTIVKKALTYSSQILIEESLKGWKEIEYEIIRDSYNNCIAVCNMENFDPLGIHTGESIVIAPSQTLSNSEYHMLREISLKVARHIGIVGECNIQFALNPASNEYRVIEVNARLSRSSALASKATGYPLAFVAAKAGLGYSLYEIKNSVTGTTTACFEPSLDYIVCKVPRWDLSKFKQVSREIGSSMKSVGEVMAIGRSFEEALQKAIRMIGQGKHGLVGNKKIEFKDLEKNLRQPTDQRIFAIAEALERGYSIEKIYELTSIDKWFLHKLKNIVDLKRQLEKYNDINYVSEDLICAFKKKGFSDFQLARFILKSDSKNIEKDLLKIRRYRKKYSIIPYVKQIDTLAAEYAANTNYLYLTYNADSHDLSFKKNRKSIVILGSGAYRIGSSVEFDWCCVSAVKAVRKLGYKAIVINFNPETVSTDYDISDKLYFDELTFERVVDIIELESPYGVIVSMGGQTSNDLALRLYEQGVKILGTSPLSIDTAEDRYKFSSLLDKLGVDQPMWKEISNYRDISKFIKKAGYPVIVRPSYVLSGAAMNIVSNESELNRYLAIAVSVSKKHPVVVSKFIEGAKEIEIDAVAKDGEIIAYAISEHVEFAGVHSGDATIVFPPQKLYLETIRRIKKITREIAGELKISGPFNIQFLAMENNIKVIECNLRASRSFPFVSKVLKIDFIDIATRIMLKENFSKPDKSAFELDYVGIKAPQFSFTRLQGADPILGVEMASTGEAGCLGESFDEALLKAMFSVGHKYKIKNVLLSTGPLESKAALMDEIKILSDRSCNLYATAGTAKFLERYGIKAKILNWPDTKKNPNVIDYIQKGKIDLVINIPKNLEEQELNNDYTIRRSAVDFNIPLITNLKIAKAYLRAACSIKPEDLKIKSWDEYN